MDFTKAPHLDDVRRYRQRTAGEFDVEQGVNLAFGQGGERVAQGQIDTLNVLHLHAERVQKCVEDKLRNATRPDRKPLALQPAGIDRSAPKSPSMRVKGVAFAARWADVLAAGDNADIHPADDGIQYRRWDAAEEDVKLPPGQQWDGLERTEPHRFELESGLTQVTPLIRKMHGADGEVFGQRDGNLPLRFVLRLSCACRGGQSRAGEEVPTPHGFQSPARRRHPFRRDL